MALKGKKGGSEQIALQNIVLGINEKKLEVSPEFLNNMTKIYISKRMSKINEDIAAFTTLKKVRPFFSKYDAVLRLLDELIAIEPLYLFNSPRPSEFKERLIAMKPQYINRIIVNRWRVAGYVSSNPLINSEIVTFFDDYKRIYELLPAESQDIILELHQRVYGYGLFEEPPAELPKPTPAESLANSEPIKLNDEIKDDLSDVLKL